MARAERWPELPDVPTLVESGFPDFTIDAWTGVVAPPARPPPIVAKLNAAINDGPEIARRPRPRSTRFSSIAKIGTPQEFGAFIARSGQAWARLVKLAGAKVE